MSSAPVHLIWFRLKYGVRRYAWGIAAPLICTLIVWPLRQVLGPSSILMTYLLGVFIVASRCGRGASITASFLSAPLFAFYFASPIFSFAIADLENMLGLVVMIVVANITSNLLDRARAQAELAQLREQRAHALYRLSKALSDAQDNQSVVAIAAQHIHQEFAAYAALLIVDEHQQLMAHVDSAHPQIDPQLAQQVMQHKTLQSVSGQFYYPLQGSQRLLAVLVIEPTQKAIHAPEVSALLETFRNLIASTLERLYLSNQARDAILQAEAESLRNALLSAISHDLRTPLTRISGAVGTLMDSNTEFSAGERMDLYKAMLDETQRMAELTGKILDMARLSSGKISLHPQWNALEEIVGSALMRLDKALQHRPVRTQLPDNLPLLWIDAVLIEQVLVNLIENAIKYTPPGSPIDIQAQREDSAIRLAVTDYGFGIPQGMEQQIFEKFFRCAPESQQSGVGLGLALCRTIVEAHGGLISVHPITGKGASFIIELPVHEAPTLQSQAIAS